MSKTIALKLTEEEVEMLIDALEVDKDGYVEAARKPAATTAAKTWLPSPKRASGSKP